MACLLRPDPTKTFCALGVVGTSPVVFLDGPPTLRVTNAEYNGAPVPIGPNGRITLTPPLHLGTNTLDLIVVGVNEGDAVTLTEDCGGGSTLALCTKHVGAAPAGGNPLITFMIDAH